ncbi:MAG: glutamate synthase-related protein, partial [Oligoflexia bacterium]|nr:glutamate synthase-related protein [Oligoflexia bacterium]
YTARGFLLALGCIQALRCHTNNCPTGITTHNPQLMKGLDIEKKSERVKNYALHILKYNYELLGALGLKSFSELKPEHVI